jgi:hypothetical protein
MNITIPNSIPLSSQIIQIDSKNFQSSPTTPNKSIMASQYPSHLYPSHSHIPQLYSATSNSIQLSAAEQMKLKSRNCDFNASYILIREQITDNSTPSTPSTYKSSIIHQVSSKYLNEILYAAPTMIQVTSTTPTIPPSTTLSSTLSNLQATPTRTSYTTPLSTPSRTPYTTPSRTPQATPQATPLPSTPSRYEILHRDSIYETLSVQVLKSPHDIDEIYFNHLPNLSTTSDDIADILAATLAQTSPTPPPSSPIHPPSSPIHPHPPSPKILYTQFIESQEKYGGPIHTQETHDGHTVRIWLATYITITE